MTKEKPDFIGKITIENIPLWIDKELDKKTHNIYCLINAKHLELWIDDNNKEIIDDSKDYIVNGRVFNTDSSFIQDVQLGKRYNLVWFDDCYYLGTIEFFEFGE